MGSLTFGRTGKLRDWIEKYVSYIPEDTLVPVPEAMSPGPAAEEEEPAEEPETGGKLILNNKRGGV